MRKFTLAIGSVLLAGAAFVPAHARGDLDVYVLYAGKNSQEKRDLVDKLPKELTVKQFNVDILALADYSGKQKAIAKFSRARVVVTVHDAPLKILKGTKVGTDLVVANSTLATVSSKKHRIHVVAKGADLKSFGSRVDVEQVTGADSFKDLETLLKADVLVVDTSVIPLADVVSKLLEALVAASE